MPAKNTHLLPPISAIRIYQKYELHIRAARSAQHSLLTHLPNRLRQPPFTSAERARELAAEILRYVLTYVKLFIVSRAQRSLRRAASAPLSALHLGANTP